MSLSAAVRAGESLVSSALWHDGRCTWIGPVNRSARDASATPYGVLGPDLYSGTAGIAWFLAHLFSSAGGEEFRRTAIAAIQHSLRGYQRLPRDRRCTFHIGVIGIAFAALELAKRLEVQELETSARLMLRNVIARGRRGAPFDLITGTAGAAAALLILAQRLHDNQVLDFAIRLGSQTIRGAKRSPAGWSWRSGGNNPINLTGLSHGAAGIGYALLELFGVTGDTRFRDAAEAAFQYEQTWFDADQENWPDFRGLSRIRGRKAPVPFSFYWCHGAPGIALSRIRAWELLANDRYRIEARAAIRTTRSAVVSSLESKRGGFSLCHGLAGNAEILYEARDVADELADGLELVKEAARESEARARLRRPGAPGFFRGLAGIGYLNLRLHDWKIPSLLLLRREQFV